MKRALIVLFSAALAVSGGLYGVASATAGTHAADDRPRLHSQRVCAQPKLGFVGCMSLLMVNENGSPFTTPTPSGYGPADFQDAYKLPSATRGEGMTVAVVDAFDDPNAESDLQVYRHEYGLPKCTTANGCFRKVDQRGGSDYPPPNTGWGLEISLDVDMVSAICPNCNILLVEADDNRFKHLGMAVNQAARMGAIAISNSYGGAEREKELKIGARFFDHKGIAVTASSGDSGFGRSSPAALSTVIAVGGTSLIHSGNKRGWDESAWSGAGSGCSRYVAKPTWQKDKGCDMRAIADVSADASPATGAAVYDTFGYPGWLVVGGTSESSPIIASVYALAGDHQTYAEGLYKHPERLFDVKSGSNGACNPRRKYLCTGGPGYDGPTGLGTPNGIGDFKAP
jgi:subtilase family serine protease